MLTFLKKLFGNAPDLKPMLLHGAVIFDVRTKTEFDAGHINGAVNFPLDTIQARIEEIKKLKKPVITVCRSGTRSAVAKSILERAGIEAYNGGAWINLKNKYAI